MIKINILHGNSCVGKSTIMNNTVEVVNKIEIDDCNYWRFKESEWSDICINFLIEQIIKNMHRKNMIMTCGGLPIPDHEVYTQLEKEYSVNFFHTLVLVKDIEKYKSYIKKRKSDDVMSELLQQYLSLIHI